MGGAFRIQCEKRFKQRIQIITYRSMWPLAMLVRYFPQYHFSRGVGHMDLIRS